MSFWLVSEKLGKPGEATRRSHYRGPRAVWRPSLHSGPKARRKGVKRQRSRSVVAYAYGEGNVAAGVAGEIRYEKQPVGAQPSFVSHPGRGRLRQARRPAHPHRPRDAGRYAAGRSISQVPPDRRRARPVVRDRLGLQRRSAAGDQGPPLQRRRLADRPRGGPGSWLITWAAQKRDGGPSAVFLRRFH